MSPQRTLWLGLSFAALLASILIYQLVAVTNRLNTGLIPSTLAPIVATTPASPEINAPTIAGRTISKTVGPLLARALAALKQQPPNFATAKQWLMEAESLPNKTAFDRYKIDEVWRYLLYRQKNYGELLKKFLLLKNDPDMLRYVSTYDKEMLSKLALAKLAAAANQRYDALQFAKEAVGENPGDANAVIVLANQQYYLREFQACLGNANVAIAQKIDANARPTEESLLLLQSCASRMNNPQQIMRALRLLCQYYPTPKNWTSYIKQLRRNSSREADFYALYLLIEAGSPQSYDYSEFGWSALIEFASPSTGARLLQQAINTSAMSNQELARIQTLHSRLHDQAVLNAQQLPQLEWDVAANPSSSNVFKLGMAYFDLGYFDRAIAPLFKLVNDLRNAPERGRALIPLALALHKSGDNEGARFVLLLAKSDPTLAGIADAWLIRIGYGTV